MDKLTDDFEKSLFNDSVDIIGDYLEIGIDSFIEKGILEEMPVVKSIVAVLKIEKNVHDRNLLRQTLTFIKEFNSGNISKDKLVEYKSTIENNPKKCEEELGRVLILLNNYIDTEKSIMLARLYRAYINKIINWNEFCEYSEIINRIFIQDLKILKKIYIGVIVDDKGANKFRIERLYSTGLIGWNPKVMFSFGEQEITENKVNINCIGRKFAEIVFLI